MAKVAETLQTLGRWCQQEGRRWIWVLDGLDRLNPDEQNALPWLPQILPDGVQVVASALACPAREILIERGYTTLTIEPLTTAEQEQLIQRYLQRYTKELDGGLREQILNHPLAGSPLFLKVLLEELRQCGRHDTLQQQLAFYLSSQTVDDLYERVLERLENDGSGVAVKHVMTALWASRAGLTEPELLAITDLKPLQWAPIDLALEKAFGYNGNRLVFAHDYLRIAVEDRYLPGGNKKRQAHAELSDWFSRSSQLINSRIYEELPWQYLRSKKIGDLRDWLLDPWNLAGLGATQGSREVLEFWEEIRSPEDAGLDEIISRDVGKEIKNCFREIGDRERLASAIADILEEAGLHGLLLLQLRKLLVEWSRFAGDDLYITSLARLAYEQYCQGFHLEASKLAQECLKLGRYKLRGAWLASLLYELAVLQERRGEVEEALSLYQQCLNIEKELYKTLRPDMLDTMECIARLKMKIGRKTEGESLYLACIEGYHALLGKEHSSSILAVRNFVASLLRYGTPCHSLPLIRQHVDWCSEKKGSRSIEYLEANRLLAVALRETGRLKDAEAAFDNIISSLENVSDATGRKELRRALGGLAKTLEVAGKLQEAATYYQLALDHRHRYEGDTAWITNLERLDLARVLHRLNRTTEALTHLADLERSIQSIDDPDDDDRQLLEDARTLRHSIQAG